MYKRKITMMNKPNNLIATLLLLSLLVGSSEGFSSAVIHQHSNQLRTLQSLQNRQPTMIAGRVLLWSTPNDNNQDEGDDDEAAKMRKKASELREQIRNMEGQLGPDRNRNYDAPKPPASKETESEESGVTGKSLRKKRVLVVGANGRLGSMVCRYLLRSNPDTEVVAAVHYIGGEDSVTTRGYGRLSYEVGAEDGAGYIGAAWSAEDRVATFEYTDEMKDYNLRNLRLVEVELLDPVQCNTITEGVDSVVWCATDFNGNQPRAVSGLNVALLFRAIADPTKGRVEIEGLRNILGGLKKNLQDQKWRAGEPKKASPNDPTNFVLVSTAPDAFGGFETPFGEFNGMKRQGEQIVQEDFPSISHSILQMSKFDENFVEEDLEVTTEDSSSNYDMKEDNEKSKRRINRRDAARLAVEALTDDSLEGKIVQVWTAIKGGILG
jgi:hypothetical protein